MNTTVDGRIDIVIFPNGGREITGRIDSEPAVPMNTLLAEVGKFVAAQPTPSTPARFTGSYKLVNNKLKITWGEWQGEIERPEEEISMASMFDDMRVMDAEIVQPE